MLGATQMEALKVSDTMGVSRRAMYGALVVAFVFALVLGGFLTLQLNYRKGALNLPYGWAWSCGSEENGLTMRCALFTFANRTGTMATGLVSFPLNRRHSLKLVYINGLHTRAGADFDQVSLAWSMRWGGEK